jgi:hypothetical protein
MLAASALSAIADIGRRFLRVRCGPEARHEFLDLGWEIQGVSRIKIIGGAFSCGFRLTPHRNLRKYCLFECPPALKTERKSTLGCLRTIQQLNCSLTTLSA